jgi:two-component system sensor histidine kinase YesM
LQINRIRKNIFIGNMYKFILFPLIPLLILGLLSTGISQYYIKQELNENNRSTLELASEYIDLILYELDALSYNFDSNMTMVITLKRVLKNSTLTYMDHKLLNLVQTTLFSQTSSKPYIHSIYLYYRNNNNRFISSDVSGLSHVNRYNDNQWYDSYMNRTDHSPSWSELRKVRMYSFETEPINILTLYKRLYSSGMTTGDGLVVLNLSPQYLEGIFQEIIGKKKQSILVLNESNEIILQYNLPDISDTLLAEIASSDQSHFTYNIGREDYLISKKGSGQNNWIYVLMVPKAAHYRISNLLSYFMFGLLLLLVAIELTLTIRLTRKNYATIMNIVAILEAAEKGQPYPMMPQTNDEYDYVIQNILRTFIEHSYYKTQLAERKYRTQVLELLALQSQINPHFLFNTLHTINWKAIALSRGPNDVSQMIENLSSILEYSLRAPVQTVTIGEEIANTKCYIDIQKLRYENKFEVYWEYDNELLNYKILKLTLQPLIENCIYHGIKQKEGECKIKIKIICKDRFLKLNVIDNGIGMTPDKLAEVRHKLSSGRYPDSKHMGLMNTSKRLHLVYGDECTIKISSKYRHGTIICIRIPIESAAHSPSDLGAI